MNHIRALLASGAAGVGVAAVVVPAVQRGVLVVVAVADAVIGVATPI